MGPVAASARFPLGAYLGLRGLVLPGRGDVQWNGIAKTADGGRTWNVVHAESDRPSPNLAPSWIEARAAEDGHSVWFDAPYDLAVAPNDPDVTFATDLFRTYRTRDGGASWAQVHSERRGEDRWSTRGLDVTTTYGVQFDPFDRRTVYIPYTDIGLFRSEDGGETWTGSTTGIPPRWRNPTYWLAFDPEVKGLVWGGFSGTHDLPRPKMVLCTSDRGLCGGFNTNLVEKAEAFIKEKTGTGIEFSLTAFGRKGRNWSRKSSAALASEHIGIMGTAIKFNEAATAGRKLVQDYLDGSADEVVIIYAEFRSSARQVPVVKKLLPIPPIEKAGRGNSKVRLSA